MVGKICSPIPKPDSTVNSAEGKKVRIRAVKVEKLKVPDAAPRFIGWAKKGKDADCVH
ncbi:MAG: hypothetical protein DDT19_02990 [Syntrophomonadaceae bacterium]|nr:hypothetical protein [Bacillota bacterium]